MERIGAEDWATHQGHVARYTWAATYIGPGDTVKDVACGIGYASTLIDCAEYIGYDKPEAWSPTFNRDYVRFVPCDLNSTVPLTTTDHALCFETLEHIEDPQHLADILKATTSRSIFVSTPIIPTRNTNPFHLHDFTEQEIPYLFEPWTVAEHWIQQDELAGVWRFHPPPHFSKSQLSSHSSRVRLSLRSSFDRLQLGALAAGAGRGS